MNHYKFLIRNKTMISKFRSTENTTIKLTSCHSRHDILIGQVQYLRGERKNSKGELKGEIEAVFQLSPGQNLAHVLRDRQDIRLFPKDLSLSIGYEVLEELDKNASLGLLLNDFGDSAKDAIKLDNEKRENDQTEYWNWAKSSCTNISSYLENVANPITKQSEPEVNELDDFNWINTNIADNDEQKIAVKNIVASTARPFPFVVFGPPGKC